MTTLNVPEHKKNLLSWFNLNSLEIFVRRHKDSAAIIE